MRRSITAIVVLVLLLQLAWVTGCAGLTKEATEGTGTIVGSVEASFPLETLLSDQAQSSDITVTGATVKLDDGTEVQAKVDLPQEDHVLLMEEGAKVRVEKREDVWFIVEVLD